MDSQEGPPNPNPFQQRILWKAITGVAITIIACLSVAALIITTKILGLLQPVLIPVAIAGILAYLLEPVVYWLRSRRLFGRSPSRIHAILMVYFIAMLGLLMLCLSVIVPASRDLGKLFNDRARIAADAKNAYLNFYTKIALFEQNIGFAPKEITDNQQAGQAVNPATPPGKSSANPQLPAATEVATTINPESQIWNEFITWLKSPETSQSMLQFLGMALHGFLGAIGYIVGLFLIPVYLFFFLKDASKIRQQWSDYVPVRQSKFKEELVSLLNEVNGYLIAYFRGQVLVSIIDGAITGIILALLGLDYALVIGLSLAIFGIIPFVGIIITAIPAMLIAASQGTGPAPLVVALVFIIVHLIDGLLIQPKIVGESVGLHPLTVIFSVLFWSLLIGGILGALLAVPLTAAIKVLFRRYIWLQKINQGENAPPTNQPDLQTA
jgi:predicted PurR-regulated permease PerM